MSAYLCPKCRQEGHAWNCGQGKEWSASMSYPVAELLRGMYGDSYADYLNRSITEHVAKGHYTESYAQAMGTAELFDGNDGD